MVTKRVVTAEEIAHLPTVIHKKVAYYLIQTGEWVIAATSGVVDITEMNLE